MRINDVAKLLQMLEEYKVKRLGYSNKVYNVILDIICDTWKKDKFEDNAYYIDLARKLRAISVQEKETLLCINSEKQLERVM